MRRALVFVLVAACRDELPAPPAELTITPGEGPGDSAVRAIVTGRIYALETGREPFDEPVAGLHATVLIAGVEVEILAVLRTNDDPSCRPGLTCFEVRVPAGLPATTSPGHTLEVVDARGQKATLPDAWRVVGPSCEGDCPSVCGDSVVDPEEACDDGNALTDACAYGTSCVVCDATCRMSAGRMPFCGDGVTDRPFEQCDDGNGVDGDGCSNACVGTDPWYLDWPLRKRIDVSLTPPEDLIDFPLPVEFSGAVELEQLALSSLDGIRFVGADQSTLLSHEVEEWDPGAGRALFWVRVPVISAATPAAIWIYYGRASVSSVADAPAVWEPSLHEAVWHLSEAPTESGTDMLDSTGHLHDGLTFNLDSKAESVGPFMSCVELQGNGWINVSPIDFRTYTELTAESWVRSTALGTYAFLSASASATVARTFTMAIEGRDLFASVVVDDGLLGEQAVMVVPAAITTLQWHHIAVTWSSIGGIARVYLDGSEVASTIQSGSTLFGLTPVQIGALTEVGPAFFGGIDEVRISSVRRSDAWLKAEASSALPSTVRIGPEETMAP